MQNLGGGKFTEVQTFPVSLSKFEIKDNIYISTTNIDRESKSTIIEKAFQAHSEGKISDAIQQYQNFMDAGFHDSIVFSNYGSILKDLGKLKEAEMILRKAIEGSSTYPIAFYNLANLLKDTGKIEEAVSLYKKAIKLKPNYAEAYCNLGSIFISVRKPKEAEFYTRKAIDNDPHFSLAYANLGSILIDNGNIKEGENFLLKAIDIQPDSWETYFQLFRHYEEINHLSQLDIVLNKFKSNKEIENELNLFRSRLKYRNKDYKKAKELIDKISQQWINKNNIKTIIYWNFKAFIEDKLKNYDEAYSCFTLSQRDPEYKVFNNDSCLENISNYKQSVFNKAWKTKKNNGKSYDDNLTFLLGFPRSGTTLLDTILRSHSDIEVIEEKPLIQTIENYITKDLHIKIKNIANIPEENLIILRKKYYELLYSYASKNNKIIIDKLPFNTVNIPLINLLFPKAKIIFAHRNPYDTVLSCFQQLFKPNAAMANLVTLKSSSIMYDQVMDAWDIYQNHLSLQFITSKYENLINSFEDHTQKILDFLGVGWDENLANYRKTALDRDKIYTPSSSQVIQPLYKSSIEKWKNYEKYFDDCHQYLEKWVSYFEY